MAVAIVTDSTSDIEPQLARALEIEVVPLFVLWGGRSYRDYIDLTREQFYAKLASAKTLPSTSQPPAELFAEAFRRALQRAHEVVCVVISSKLSGTINAARSAAAQLPKQRVRVVDSLSVAGGLQMQVSRALELARRDASAEEICNALAAERAFARVYAALPDLSHVLRTGRIGKARFIVGTLMKIVPVLSLADGEVVAAAQVRTFARAVRTVVELTVRAIADPARSRLMVMHTNAPGLAEETAQQLREALNGRVLKSLQIQEAGPVIATHGGPGAVGIFSAQDE